MFADALAGMLQWRLLVLWVVALLLPTLAVYLPIAAFLGPLLDWSPRAAELARRFDMLAFEDIGYAFQHSGGAAVGGGMMLGSILTVVLSPLLAGMMVTAARHAERPLGFVALAAGALAWYGRMFRLWLVSLVPLAVAGGVAAGLFKLAQKHGEAVVTEAQANRGQWAAMIAALVLFVVVHATIEAGRAQLGANESLRSGWRAWLRGVRLTFRRPVAVLGLYLGVTLVSWLVASVLLLVRIRIAGANAALFWLGVVVTQLGVAAIGWGRGARIAALMTLARQDTLGARDVSAPPTAAASAPAPMS
jgi:hypothetical protein